GIEVGAGTTHAFDSRMWTVSGYAKVALHEGFHHLPIPTLALRGMFSELLGSKDMRLTTISIDGQASHVFGVGSTFSITPYVGYQTLLMIARSGVMDVSPETDEYTDPSATDPAEFAF